MMVIMVQNAFLMERVMLLNHVPISLMAPANGFGRVTCACWLVTLPPAFCSDGVLTVPVGPHAPIMPIIRMHTTLAHAFTMPERLPSPCLIIIITPIHDHAHLYTRAQCAHVNTVHRCMHCPHVWTMRTMGTLWTMPAIVHNGCR